MRTWPVFWLAFAAVLVAMVIADHADTHDRVTACRSAVDVTACVKAVK